MRRGVVRRGARPALRPDERNRAAALVRGTHPFNVQPLGNLLMAPSAAEALRPRSAGLGVLAVLPDDVLVQSILAELSPWDLLRLGRCSRTLYVFARHDALWKSYVVDTFGGDFDFDGSWRRTFFRMSDASAAARTVEPSQLHLPPLYSDFLFDAWLGASHEVRPSWLEGESIPRRAGLSRAEFVAQYEEPNRPVILTDVVPRWPSHGVWSADSLCARFGEARFQAGEVSIRLRQYLSYARQTHDEVPLYIFDHAFGETAPELAAEYTVPEYFSDDLFALLGAARPKYRWILFGPARSGSVFHKDPNSTSAWNAVLSGSKRWIMLPPDVTPPGVFPSADGAEVTAPVSVIDWLNNYLQAARAQDPPPLEATVRAGELIFVPRGWWHLVLNVDEGVALTQNYVGRESLPHVLRFLRDKPEQVSGYRGTRPLYDVFTEKLAHAMPDLLHEALARLRDIEADEQRKECGSLWKRLKTDEAQGAFSFGFGDDADDDADGGAGDDADGGAGEDHVEEAAHIEGQLAHADDDAAR